MADEPTGNLDSTNGRMILDLLLEHNKRAGTTLVLVTHDPEVASTADRRIVLRDGLIVEDTLPYAAEDSAEQVHAGSPAAGRSGWGGIQNG
jgi:putative ABC transport system ATP-binding protein